MRVMTVRASLFCALMLSTTVADAGRFRRFGRRLLVPPAPPTESPKVADPCEGRGPDCVGVMMLTPVDADDDAGNDELSFETSYALALDETTSSAVIAAEYKFGRFWNTAISGAIARDDFRADGSTEGELAIGFSPPGGQIPERFEWQLSVVGQLAEGTSGGGAEATAQYSIAPFGTEVTARATFGEATVYSGRLDGTVEVGAFEIGLGVEHENVVGDMEDAETVGELQVAYKMSSWKFAGFASTPLNDFAPEVGALVERTFELKLKPRPQSP
jgi:hypothetical protein